MTLFDLQGFCEERDQAEIQNRSRSNATRHMNVKIIADIKKYFCNDLDLIFLLSDQFII